MTVIPLLPNYQRLMTAVMHSYHRIHFIRKRKIYIFEGDCKQRTICAATKVPCDVFDLKVGQVCPDKALSRPSGDLWLQLPFYGHQAVLTNEYLLFLGRFSANPRESL